MCSPNTYETPWTGVSRMSEQDTSQRQDIPRLSYERANCSDTDAEAFTQYYMHAIARKACMKCPTLSGCYFEAARHGLDGTWGGVWWGPVGHSRLKEEKRQALEMMRYQRKVLRAALGMTLEEFVSRFGDGTKGIRKALMDLDY